MADQLVERGQWGTIGGGVGTTVLRATDTTLRKIVVPGTYIGSVTFHDAATAAGTTGTSGIITLGLPTTSIPFDLEINAKCRYGLTYQATGTPVMTVIYE